MEKQEGGIVRRALLNASDVHPHWKPLQRAVKREAVRAKREAVTERLSSAPANVSTLTRPRRARRSRERRDSRSCARSGDSPDGDAEPPTELWRWASERSWRNLVASVESRDFERELYLERMHGVAR